MDFRDLYQETFAGLLANLKAAKGAKERVASETHRSLGAVLCLEDDSYQLSLYKDLVEYGQRDFASSLGGLVRRMFERSETPWMASPADPKNLFLSMPKEDYPRLFPFVLKEDGLLVGYKFVDDAPCASDAAYLAKQAAQVGVDRVVYVVARGREGAQGYAEVAHLLNEHLSSNTGGMVSIEPLPRFFERAIGPGEFEIFLSFVDDYRDCAREIISFGTVYAPTPETMPGFKEACLAQIRTKEAAFRKRLYDEGILQGEIDRLCAVYFNDSRCECLVGDGAFARSYVSAEWFYSIHRLAPCLEQTGAVVGYLKSVEQILKAFTELYLDDKTTSRYITLSKDKDPVPFSSAVEGVDRRTAGAMIEFLDRTCNRDLLVCGEKVKALLIKELKHWNNVWRNGYLHTCNIDHVGMVDEIRDKAMFAHFLLLSLLRLPGTPSVFEPVRSSLPQDSEEPSLREALTSLVKNTFSSKPTLECLSLKAEDVLFSILGDNSETIEGASRRYSIFLSLLDEPAEDIEDLSYKSVLCERGPVDYVCKDAWDVVFEETVLAVRDLLQEDVFPAEVGITKGVYVSFLNKMSARIV